MASHPPERHNRPAVISDIKNHQYVAEYMTGDKTAITGAEASLEALEKADEPSSFNKNVWLSGAHMRIAVMLRTDNPEKARMHLNKAREIIDSDERLVLRREQLEKLTKTFE